ncbi:TIGR04540 family protein [Fictibacillus barbaricus]|uniref:TIGR04540 family protein n=1 Tax=Fictibacillus barbaricus TaxID=182136 RepID=A0ABS2ZCP9_9BACL|nr:TIGR04540 family protein [Fictibacillus barbaricus]MBN3545083.1 TIGR04540 family protein [Fictibacillus barbaricus]GGB61884.1 hypothetical protein GCM10007199_29680 [Fictibacillus barbaricus]
MKVKLFYRTQRELATALNQLVDAYWKEEIEEQELIVGVKNMYENNLYKLRKGSRFTKVIEQQCGKRRLEVVVNILKL